MRLFVYGDCCGGFNPVPAPLNKGDFAFIGFLESDGLADANGRKVGYYHTACTLEADRVPPRSDPGQVCAYYLNLRDGQIVAEGAGGDQQPWTVPIIGGTGAYLGARGSVTTVGPTRIGYSFVVRVR